MTVFIDTGVFVGAALRGDGRAKRASAVLQQAADMHPVTTDHVLIEVWHLLRHRAGRDIANRFWFALRDTPVVVECVNRADLERGEGIAAVWADQDFDIVDCTSFAVMERLGCTAAASFDQDFAVYRYGADRRKAFQILG